MLEYITTYPHIALGLFGCLIVSFYHTKISSTIAWWLFIVAALAPEVISTTSVSGLESLLESIKYNLVLLISYVAIGIVYFNILTDRLRQFGWMIIMGLGLICIDLLFAYWVYTGALTAWTAYTFVYSMYTLYYFLCAISGYIKRDRHGSRVFSVSSIGSLFIRCRKYL